MSNIRYSPDADVLDIRLSNEPVDHGEDFGQVIVHLSPENKPVAIEILEASEFVRDLLKATIERGLEFPKAEGSVGLHTDDVIKRFIDDMKQRTKHAKQHAK